MPIHRHGLAVKTIEKVINFCKSDEISRLCPGKKDYVTVREKGSQAKVQRNFSPVCNCWS